MDETTIVTDLYYLADKFSFFEYKHFTHEFMVRLKQEMKPLVEEAKRDNDLIESSHQKHLKQEWRNK